MQTCVGFLSTSKVPITSFDANQNAVRDCELSRWLTRLRDGLLGDGWTWIHSVPSLQVRLSFSFHISIRAHYY